MSINQDTRKAWSQVSNPELAAMKSDPESIMQNRANLSIQTIFRQARLKSKAVHEPKIRIEASLESDSDGPLSKPTFGLAPAPAITPFIFKLLITTELKGAMR